MKNTIAAHIPFISSQEALRLALTHYKDSELIRVPLERADSFVPRPKQIKLWIDPGVDGFEDSEARRPQKDRPNSWFDFMKGFAGFERFADSCSTNTPDSAASKRFLKAVLDECVTHHPNWITVPQLPLGNDSRRNKINRELAKVTGQWRDHTNYTGKLILPIVFTHQDQTGGKVSRNQKIDQAKRCYQNCRADGFWVADTSLDEESASPALRNKRFKATIALHQELNEELKSDIRIAGPYWGMNLLLWVRGLINYPAIGLGNSYRYFLSGGMSKTPSPRLAIEPLRRRVGVAQLKSWLDETLEIIGSDHQEAPKLTETRKRLPFLSDPSTARKQVSEFYKAWFDSIAEQPPAGRSMALFQDLAAAFAFGKGLPELTDEGAARRPESIVEPLMLNCLLG